MVAGTAARRFGRHKERDTALILIAFRHGLMVGELIHAYLGHRFQHTVATPCASGATQQQPYTRRQQRQAE
ncbi:hypothetical protein Hthe01_19870 [Hydrogenophilus thermoluteolus]|nr:hypothetical protein Hthe01_19870 [Hydrogenophilus thermoluteolus]